jgi:VCBS repeat-containing protein
LTGAQITALTAAMVTGKLSFTAGVLSNGGTQTIGYTYDASAANLDFLAAGQTLTVTYAVQVSDGTATSGTQSLSFVVTGTNDAPVLSTTVPTSVNVSGGVQVSSFLNSTDLDTSALSGIAITGTTTNGGGTWQYSTDGVTWTNFGAVSGSSSLLLTSSTRVRITGSGNSGTLTYRAWDQTSGTASVNGTPHIADTTTNGGTTAFSTASVTWSVSHPAGIAGSPINLALTDPSTGPSDTITVTVSGVPSDWSLNAGTNNGGGSWTVETSDPSALTVTTPASFAGAMVLNVSESWTNPDGSMGGASIKDNVEAYPASPIFAVSADDTLTGSGGNDEFVFAQPIGHDRVYDFNPADDTLDLIGFGIAGFADLQAGIANDAGGNAVVTLGAGETITLVGVDAGALSANNFVFDEEPRSTNAGTMSVGDGAILPIGGTIDNTGTIALGSTGDETDLEILVRGATLQGGGTLTLSDNSANVVFGGDPSARLTNVDNTISGAGQLGVGQLTFVNEGTILANGSNALVIDTGSNAVGNSGTLEATGTGGLMIKSNVDNTGTLRANGGNLTVEGAVSGNGSAEIDGTSRLEFGAASTANTAFGTGDGTLKLAQSTGFTGTIAGFGAGDAIDLADLGFGGSTTLAYAANQDGSGGTLSVSDGTHSTSLALLGQYAATGFQGASDPGAGTLITYTPPHANDPNLLTNPV